MTGVGLFASVLAPLMLASGVASADPPPPIIAQLPARKGMPQVTIRIDRAEAAPKTPSVEERVQRGVVTIERAGQAVGLGTVLMGDGRILTALSPLGGGNDLDARFADGTVRKVKLGHSDRAWDLALLVPQAGRWTEGLAASSREPVRPDAAIHAFSLAAQALRGAPPGTSKVAALPIILRSHRSFLGGDDQPIENALEIGSRVSPLDLGAPLVDEDGRVVGVLGRGCAPAENRPCTPVAFGAPMSAIRSFLRTVPPTAVAPSAWLGIQGISETAGIAKGVRVLGVHPQSPAAESKIKGGERSESDVIVAVDGVPVTSPESLADAIRAHGIGEKVPMLVFSKGRYRDVNVVLRAPPEAKAAAAPPANPAELPAYDAPVRRPLAPRY